MQRILGTSSLHTCKPAPCLDGQFQHAKLVWCYFAICPLRLESKFAGLNCLELSTIYTQNTGFRRPELIYRILHILVDNFILFYFIFFFTLLPVPLN